MKVRPAERSSSSTSLTRRPRNSCAEAGAASNVHSRSQLASCNRCFMRYIVTDGFPQPGAERKRVDRQRDRPYEEGAPYIMRDEMRAARLLREAERQPCQQAQGESELRQRRVPLAKREV